MRSHTKDSYQERILKVLVHIQENLNQDLSLAELAEVACFSPYHFHRVFRGMVGEPVAEYVRRLRLDWSANQLRRSERSVTDLALEAGYDSLEAFTRAFRQRFGVAPSHYRTLQRPDIPLSVSTEDAADWPRMDKGAVMKVDIVNLEPRKVAFVRHVGPYDQCGIAWEKLCSWAGPAGLMGPDTEFLGLCHDDPEVTEAQNIRYDACMPVGSGVSPAGEIGVQEVAGGFYAKALHQGPYDRLKDTYAWVCGQWLPRQNREMRNLPSIEVYLNDPDQTPPTELLVEVYVPLES
jgi:AraC family transcriptional regulator